jgi:hypothetical protein
MNKSPDAGYGKRGEARTVLLDESVLEDRIIEAGEALKDPALLADRALREELRGLDPIEPLPPSFKRDVLARTASRRRWPGLPVALAAGLAGVLVLASAVRDPDPTISRPTSADAEALRTALVTVDRTSRDALGRAGREVGEHLKFPSIELEQLPYGHLLRSFVITPPQAPQPEEK